MSKTFGKLLEITIGVVFSIAGIVAALIVSMLYLLYSTIKAAKKRLEAT